MTSRKRVSEALETIGRVSQKGADPFRVYQQAYDQTIKRIDGQEEDHRILARKTIAWITHAQVPLHVDELLHALAVEEDDEKFDVENAPVSAQVVSVCAGLVTIDQESSIVRLIHYTTQEYLEKVRDEWLPTAKRDIAVALTHYLTYTEFSHREGIIRCESDGQALFKYAVKFWLAHTRETQHMLDEFGVVLLQREDMLTVLSHLNHYERHLWPSYQPWQTNAVHVTAELGFNHLIVPFHSE